MTNQTTLQTKQRNLRSQKHSRAELPKTQEMEAPPRRLGQRRCARRFVMFAGPGKTGSTTIQQYYSEDNAIKRGVVYDEKGSKRSSGSGHDKKVDGHHDKHPDAPLLAGTLGNWTYPLLHHGRAWCDALKYEAGSKEATRPMELARKVGDIMAQSNDGNIFWPCEEAAYHYHVDPTGRALSEVLDAYHVTQDITLKERDVDAERPRLAKTDSVDSISETASESVSIDRRDLVESKKKQRAKHGHPEQETSTIDDEICPEFIFHFRSPRLDHFLSAWKQITGPVHPRFQNWSIHDLVCDDRPPQVANGFWFHLPKFTNPLKAALDFRFGREWNAHDDNSDPPRDWPVTIVDMGGVQAAGRDIVHVLSCDILGMPCRNGWMLGHPLAAVDAGALNETTPTTIAVANARVRNDVDLTPRQRVAIETLYRKRDCIYRDPIRNDPGNGFRILFEHDLWPDCPADLPASYLQLDEVDFFLQQLKRIMSCPGSESLPTFEDLGVDLDGIDEDMSEVIVEFDEKKIPTDAVVTPPLPSKASKPSMNDRQKVSLPKDFDNIHVSAPSKSKNTTRPVLSQPTDSIDNVHHLVTMSMTFCFAMMLFRRKMFSVAVATPSRR